VVSPDSQSSAAYVVFGGTGGIGSSLCRRLVSRGARLLVAARNEDKLRTLAQGLNVSWRSIEATRWADVDTCIKRAAELFGRLDGVANCIGSLLLKPAHSTSESEWQATIATNLTTSFAVVRASARAMTGAGGSVVLVSSAAARVGLANHEAIAAAKAGVIGLTLSAAATYAPRGIRVNCVAPGLVRTPMTAGLTTNETVLKASSAMHALRRIGEPEDVAAAIDWLLSPEQSWVTGQVLGVDGGLAAVRPR